VGRQPKEQSLGDSLRVDRCKRAGRRVITASISTFGPKRHVIAVDREERRKLLAGTSVGYIIRLTETARSASKRAEWDIWRAERVMRTARERQHDGAPLVLVLDRVPPEAAARAPDVPLGWPRVRQLGTLIATGGLGVSEMAMRIFYYDEPFS
jgi:hypothetical protein